VPKVLDVLVRTLGSTWKGFGHPAKGGEGAGVVLVEALDGFAGVVVDCQVGEVPRVEQHVLHVLEWNGIDEIDKNPEYDSSDRQAFCGLAQLY
jgi:hypothetical protein